MKTFWVNIITFFGAGILFIFSAKLGLDVSKIWYGLFVVFGMYSGCDGLATVITSKQMPKNVQYTASYSKMTALVLLAWALFLETVALQALFRDFTPNLDLSTGFLFAATISGVYAGTKKTNNGMKNLGSEDAS